MFDPVLSVEDLHKAYGRRQAVGGISLSIARGEIFGLLGPNGAGKTTMISMLAGLFEPDSGTIMLDGVQLHSHSRREKARIGLVPQELAIYPTLSAHDNLLFFGRMYGLRGRHLSQRIAEALEIVGLAERRDAAVSSFSGGMKRRLNIAAGLLHEPELLILDEPTVGVDPQSRNAIFEGVEALNRAGLTIIHCTHYMEEAQRLCQRVAIIDEGQLIALDTPAALIRSLEGGIIRVALDNDASSQLAEQAHQLPAINKLRLRDGLLEIETRRAQEALSGILEVANQLGARITSLHVLEPSLETVFLQLTGKALRD